MAQVLFLTQVLPFPLDAGPKIRAYYVLRHLAQAHDITLVSFVRGDDQPEYVDHLKSFCREVHVVPMRRSRLRDVVAVVKAVATGLPVIIARDEIAEMHALLKRLVAAQHYDVIHADQISTTQYAQYAREESLKLGQMPKSVFDAHNALFRVFDQLAADATNWVRQLALRREARAIERYERRMCRAFDQVVFVSAADRRALAARATDAERLGPVIPICVDSSERALLTPDAEQPLVTHLGTMFWPPNVQGVLWFIREVWPAVLSEVPHARLVIIGKRPPPQLLTLAKEHSAIDVLGFVENPESYLWQTAAFIVPLFAGAGMRVKIMDAWAWGLPVVTTTLGAEGIDVEDGKDALVAESPSAFAKAVVRLLRDCELRMTLRREGRSKLTESYDWRTRYDEWDAVYEALTTR